MDKLALEGAWTELNRARDNIEALATLTPTDKEQIQKIKDHWAAFLAHAGRVFNKLSAGSKSRSKSEAWFGRIKHQRKTDPFLIYIHHARNADEHVGCAPKFSGARQSFTANSRKSRALSPALFFRKPEIPEVRPSAAARPVAARAGAPFARRTAPD